MAITERLNDPIFVGQLQSLGTDLPHALLNAFSACHLVIDPSHIPAFHIDTGDVFAQLGHFATAHLVPGEKRKTLHVKLSILAKHAEELWYLLRIVPTNEHEQERLESYCLMQAMVELTLQAIVDFNEEEKTRVHNKFTEINF